MRRTTVSDLIYYQHLPGYKIGGHLYINKKMIRKILYLYFCIKHTIPGDWNLTTKEEVISLMESYEKLDVKR